MRTWMFLAVFAGLLITSHVRGQMRFDENSDLNSPFGSYFEADPSEIEVRKVGSDLDIWFVPKHSKTFKEPLRLASFGGPLLREYLIPSWSVIEKEKQAYDRVLEEARKQKRQVIVDFRGLEAGHSFASDKANQNRIIRLFEEADGPRQKEKWFDHQRLGELFEAVKMKGPGGSTPPCPP